MDSTTSKDYRLVSRGGTVAGKAGHRGFGHIRRLPSKRYQASYIGPDIARYKAPQTFETKEDAEGWLADERRLIHSKGWTPPPVRAQRVREAEERRKAHLFAAYARNWLNNRHDLRPTTVTSYKTAIEQHLVPALGDQALEEITTEDVRRWFSSYGQRTPTARAHAYQVLVGIMSQAHDDELITRNPARIKGGGRAPASREPDVLTLSELVALADAMPPRHRALTLLCGLGGLRFGEAVALRRRDIDLDTGTVAVTRTATRANGQKSTNAPKTSAGHRTIAIPALVIDELRRHLKDMHIPNDQAALIFPGRDGQLLAPTALYGRSARTERRGSKTFTKAAYGFHAARESIGKPNLHWHDLRRTAATLGAQSGATVREMQHRLGHATPAMALHYQAATAERDRAIAERLQEKLDALKQDKPRLHR